ncbi:MAG TPA: MFS transporter [Caldilineaceae bacterium]|nr:MFS transporter [Caldilineaceae bacterium]
MARLLRGEFYYGWVVVAVTALTLIVSAGIRSAPGVMLLPLQAETGWSLSVISFSVSLGLLLFGFSGPFGGALMDRFGPRRLMIAGLALVGVALIASARMAAIWQLYLFWGALSGMGTGLMASVLGATVASRWFVARRGLVVGIFGAATSAGQLIFVPLLMQWVLSLGWRTTLLLLAGVMALLLAPILLWMRDDPAEVGLRPYGAAPQPAGPATAPAEPQEGTVAVMGRAVRTSEFWLLAGTFFVCGVSSNGLVGTHLIPYAVDCGIAAGTAAGMLALMGLMNFVGTIGSGWLTDRYDPRRLLAIYYSFRGLSLLLLPAITTPVGLGFFAVLFGLDYIATVPPTVSLTADTFGRRHVGTVFGWVFCAHQIGAALAAWVGGVVRETAGDYALAFIAAGVLAGMAGMLALRIRRQPIAAPVVPAAA